MQTILVTKENLGKLNPNCCLICLLDFELAEDILELVCKCHMHNECYSESLFKCVCGKLQQNGKIVDEETAQNNYIPDSDSDSDDDDDDNSELYLIEQQIHIEKHIKILLEDNTNRGARMILSWNKYIDAMTEEQDACLIEHLGDWYCEIRS